jgi:hypothetical protein
MIVTLIVAVPAIILSERRSRGQSGRNQRDGDEKLTHVKYSFAAHCRELSRTGAVRWS